MKKVINENKIRAIVRESLRNYLKESMDSKFGMGEESDGWTPEMDDMWDEFGNNNVHDTDGAFGVLAQGDDDDYVSRVAKTMRSTKADSLNAMNNEFGDSDADFMSDDNAEYLRSKISESTIKNAVNRAVKKVLNEISSDLAFNAAVKAQNKERYKQSDRFNTYGLQQIRKEYGLSDQDTTTLDRNHIAFFDTNQKKAVLYHDGYLEADNVSGDWVSYRDRPSVHLADPKTARRIALWWKKYNTIGTENAQPGFDWHFWARL